LAWYKPPGETKASPEATVEYGVKTKTGVIDLALRELLRKRAVARVLAAGGKSPGLPTNEELEGSSRPDSVPFTEGKMNDLDGPFPL
jgi:hypothetical protein